MAVMSGGDAVVGSLLAHGVDTLYCLPGVQSDHLFNAIFDTHGAMRPVHTRHEQAAGYMALGSALATGKPAAYSVVPGPGFLNSCAALCTAYALNAPVVALIGQLPSAGIGQGWGLLHEIPDQLSILKQLTKWAERIETPGEAPQKIADAFRQLASGRSRPVGIELPADILAKKADVSPVAPLAPDAPPAALPADVERAADLIKTAKRPLIFAGTGAIHAAEEIRQFAELTGIPVIGHRTGRGILDARHPLSHTQAAAYELWKTADLVIGIGSRVSLPLQTWGSDDNLKLIRIDLDPEELARFRAPDVAILADSRDVLRALLGVLKPGDFDAKARIQASLDHKAWFAKWTSGLEPQLSYLRVIRDVLPESGILIDDLTQVGYVSRIAYPVYKPRTFLNSGYQGTLGWGVSTALGAKDAVGDTPVVVISGDGGFMYQIQEFSTAVRHNLSPVFIVFNDSAFGNVRRMQQEEHGNRVIASDLFNPDFLKFADSFGIRGHRVRSPQELQPVLERALAGKEPVIIEVPIGEVPSPWGFIQFPKVRG